MYCLCTQCIIVNSVQVRSKFGKFAYTAICMRKCTLWSDNTCVFSRFHCVKNANTQLIWSSVIVISLLFKYKWVSNYVLNASSNSLKRQFSWFEEREVFVHKHFNEGRKQVFSSPKKTHDVQLAYYLWY